jgi:hypothetical protein
MNSFRSLCPSSRGLPFSLVALLLSSTVNAELTVSTDFPGGSAEVKELDAERNLVHVHPAFREERGWPCWWYFRLDGLQKGEPVTLKVSAQPKPFRGNNRLAASWSQPDRAAISIDDVTWTQTPPCRKEDGTAAAGTAIYEFDAPAERIWLAWGPPFLPSHTEELLARIEKQIPDAERFTLAETRGGRPVHGIRIGGGTEEEPAPLAVWVNARQHAWESGGSWVARGFLEWVASDDPAAVELRKSTSLYVVPIMDVDNVVLGAGGKEAIPRDHNRDWAEEPVYPEVAAAQKRIRKLNREGRLQAYLDLHNPGAGSKQPFYFGPAHLKDFQAREQENYARFLAYSIEMIRGPLAITPEYRFATYVRTDEERRRMSKEWVIENTQPHVLALTLETAWNTPASTQEGYLTVGRQLAQALARYLSEAPAEASR